MNGSLKFILEIDIHASIIHWCLSTKISLNIVGSMINRSSVSILFLYYYIWFAFDNLKIFYCSFRMKTRNELHKTITLSDLCVYKMVKVVFNVFHKLLWCNFITVSWIIFYWIWKLGSSEQECWSLTSALYKNMRFWYFYQNMIVRYAWKNNATSINTFSYELLM